MRYIPVKVNKRTQKHLIRDASGHIFHRIDEDGQCWVKAADKYGRLAIEIYGLVAVNVPAKPF